ncbi:MAG: OmpH family outer membrane protein [Flavobacteriales bacterium]|nr:OmpH family outer membrane protein [Flavobacteriales bacterium]
MKHIILTTILTLGLFTSASAQKFGHINAQEVLMNLPERAQAQGVIESQAAEYQAEVARMQEDLQTKFAEYQAKSETWPAAIREQKERELQGLDQGLQEFGSTVQNELAATEQELLMPMIERVQAAINAVGAENGFTYIFDSSTGATVYNGGEDISELVKVKLGM